ncbi:ABC transporter ATP-binding protein [Lewinella sp. IMCC34191]|uniref:ABC transporter ATP-binding protein n=1 Tax=Lewinella sp. IMCC34191 TaxID=2259172 RepID=UPI000E238688|nr:ATP-binding cassette domain-containing protein [Lewinella sp. IMCC34191]
MIELLNVNGLSVSYGQPTAAVSDVNLAVLPGESVALVGPSGSGKSSCAAALLGLLPKRGVQVRGEARYQLKDGRLIELINAPAVDLQRIRGREIGMIFQEPAAALNPVLTCGYQLREAIDRLKPNGVESEAYLERLLAQVELDTIRDRLMTAMPGQLSGGQLQRLMIAMALAGQPRLLIADEPTTALDSITELEIVRLLDALRRDHHMGLLFITHDQRLIRRVTDRSVTLSGRSAERQSAGEGRTETKDVPEVVGKVKTLVEVRSLSVRFADAVGEESAVNDCSFTLAAGEWVGLIGPSGCGKSTVANWLTGLRTATAGEIIFKGKSHPAGSHPAKVRQLIGGQLIFQNVSASLNPRMSVRDAVREAVPGRIKGVAEELLSGVGLPPERFAALRPHQLSGGERQRLAIARALAAQPRVLVCDEALSGLDIPLRKEVVGVLKKVCSERGIGVLLITHDLELARTVTDRLLLMENGRIVERGPVEKILNHPDSELGHRLLATLKLRQP